MNAVLDLPYDTARKVETHPDPAERLRQETAAVRVSFTWFGTRKALTPGQKAEAAEAFGAEGVFLSAGKKLLDTRDPHFKAVTAIKGQTLSYWRGISLPYPEPGLRLIRRDQIAGFTEHLSDFKRELELAVRDLDRVLESLKSAAQERLGRLFDPCDYPRSLIEEFDLSWDFPSVEPPDYLRRLHPEIYREECYRARSRFQEAVRLAEQAFTENLPSSSSISRNDSVAARTAGRRSSGTRPSRISASSFSASDNSASAATNNSTKWSARLSGCLVIPPLRNCGSGRSRGRQSPLDWPKFVPRSNRCLSIVLGDGSCGHLGRRSRLMKLIITSAGTVRGLYSEEIELTSLGSSSIRRASHVDPTDEGKWSADLSPVGGPVLGPFAQRSNALAAEVAWLEQHWLPRTR